MEDFNPTEHLKKNYNDKLTYNYWISASIAQGEAELVSDFLKKVPDSDKRGTYLRMFFNTILTAIFS